MHAHIYVFAIDVIVVLMIAITISNSNAKSTYIINICKSVKARPIARIVRVDRESFYIDHIYALFGVCVKPFARFLAQPSGVHVLDQ
jgi:hypothetical protein